MSPNRNEHLRYRFGICLNDSCEKCKSKEIQQIPSRKDFVCANCGKSLRECPPPKSFGQKYGKLIIIAGVIVVAAIVGVILWQSLGNETGEVVPVATDSVATNEKETDKNKVAANSVDSVARVASKDSVAEVSKDSVGPVPPTPAPAKVAQTTTNAPVRQNAREGSAETSAASMATRSSKHRLSYGTWTGGWKNGQPHGQGTLTYSTTRTIDSRDTKGRVAQPGEYIVGEWDNGHLVQGRWFKNDGTKEAIIIGKAG